MVRKGLEKERKKPIVSLSRHAGAGLAGRAAAELLFSASPDTLFPMKSSKKSALLAWNGELSPLASQTPGAKVRFRWGIFHF